MIRHFSLGGVGKKAAVFDSDKLSWVNQQHMMRLSVDELLAHLRALQLTDDASDQVLGMSAATAKAYLCLYQSRATTLTELADSVRTLGTRPVMSQIPESASWLAPNTGRLIHQFIEEVETLSVWDKHALLDTGRRVVKSASVGLALSWTTAALCNSGHDE